MTKEKLLILPYQNKLSLILKLLQTYSYMEVSDSLLFYHIHIPYSYSLYFQFIDELMIDGNFII